MAANPEVAVGSLVPLTDNDRAEADFAVNRKISRNTLRLPVLVQRQDALRKRAGGPLEAGGIERGALPALFLPVFIGT